MAKSTVEITIVYKNGNFEYFSIPADEAHAQELVDIGTELAEFKDESTFILLTNKDSDEGLFVNLGEVRTVHMKTVVAE